MKDQLVTGFTFAIKSGKLADGEPLPGVRRLATVFGVSEITVRHAVRQLSRDGLLATRPRVGITVCRPGSRFWRGSVLGIKSGPPGMYFDSVLEDSIASALRRNGWLYSSVSLTKEDGSVDMQRLDMLLESSPRMVVTFHAVRELARCLVSSRIGFVEAIPNKVSAESEFSVRIDCSRALSRLADDLLGSGVRTVLSVYQHPSAGKSFPSVLRSKGLKVRTLRVEPLGGCNTAEAVQRAGMLGFSGMFSRGGVKEDAVVCNDDYLAAGILSACDRHGIRLPEDFRFATVSNKGLGPVYAGELTRIEVDPAKFGERVGLLLADKLNGAGPDGVVNLDATYIRGVTA